LAVVLDGEVLTAPVIREPILGGTAMISGSLTVEQAVELAILLRAGELPAAALADRHGGVRLGALLGARGAALRARGAADAAGVREGLRQAQQDRRAGRGGDLRGGGAAGIRASFVAKRTAAANQLRGELSEFGIVAPTGKRGLSDLLSLVETAAARFLALPAALRLVLAELARQWRSCDEVVRRMEVEIAVGVKKSARAMRLTRVPTIGPIGASAIDAMLPNPHVFKSGRHYAAFLGLTPREDSSGNTVKRGGITKKGDTYLRRILVQGATSYLAKVRSGQAKGASAWALRMAAHPKRKLAAVALANKTARIAWAMLAHDQDYRAPAAALKAAA
jgi:hypothetical protein